MNCSIENCGRSAIARGWCREHYYRWRRNGDPLGGRASHGRPMRWIEDHASYQGSECLTWPFRRGGRGYAYISNEPASRRMCELAHGAAPSAAHQAAHSCGNGHLGCINPRHLRWATKQDNERDKIAHGTLRVGRQLPWAKLTEDQVREIRRLKECSHSQIAKQFGVSRSLVGQVIQGKIWRKA